MTRAEIETVLVDFVASDLLDGDARDLDAQTPLLELGIIDSLTIVSLLSFLETRFGARIAPENVRPEHFVTIAAIAVLTERARSEDEDET
ncbi:MAG: acyl carrier protein [Polyangiaceae bacterium]